LHSNKNELYYGICCDKRKKANGKVLLRLLKGIDGTNDYVRFMDREKELELAITDAMKTQRVKSGNSLREIEFKLSKERGLYGIKN
jgi:hypothetical protein